MHVFPKGSPIEVPAALATRRGKHQLSKWARNAAILGFLAWCLRRWLLRWLSEVEAPRRARPLLLHLLSGRRRGLGSRQAPKTPPSIDASDDQERIDAEAAALTKELDERSPHWDREALWEHYLTFADFPEHGPLRKHLRQLLNRGDVDDQLSKLYERLQAESSAGSLSREAAERLSFSMSGTVRLHGRFDSAARVGLMPPTPAGSPSSFLDCFQQAFPEERPLDVTSFPGFAKLVIVRRVLRTLLQSCAAEELKRGPCPTPLVIDVSVDLRDGYDPFRLHTVTPLTSVDLGTGESLSLIEEVDTPMSTMSMSNTGSTKHKPRFPTGSMLPLDSMEEESLTEVQEEDEEEKEA